MLDEHGYHLIGRRDVVIGEAELLPETVTTNQIGDRILEFRDDAAKRLLIGWGLAVEDDLKLDAKFLGNAHGIATTASMGVVVDRDAHAPCLAHRSEPDVGSRLGLG